MFAPQHIFKLAFLTSLNIPFFPDSALQAPGRQHGHSRYKFKSLKHNTLTMVYCVVQQMGNYKLCMTELQLRAWHQRGSTRQIHEINNRRR